MKIGISGLDCTGEKTVSLPTIPKLQLELSISIVRVSVCMTKEKLYFFRLMDVQKMIKNRCTHLKFYM